MRRLWSIPLSVYKSCFPCGLRALPPWRTRAEPYLVPLMMMLTLGYSSTYMRIEIVEGYWPAVTGGAGGLLFVIAPLCALAGAWEGARWRRAGLDRWPIARAGWRVALAALWPTLAMGVVGVLTALGSLAPLAAGAPGVPDLRLLGVYVLVVAAHTVVGYALGRVAHPALALPIALASSYLWLGYIGAIEPLWARHLSGMYLRSCCSVDEVPSERAIVGPSVVAFGIIVGALCWLSRSSWRTRIPAALVVLSCALVGVGVVMPLGAQPVRARHGGLDCDGGTPRICLWPEHRDEAVAIRRELGAGYVALTTAGLSLPQTLTTERTDDVDRLWVVLPVDPSPDRVLVNLAGSLLPEEFPTCSAEEDYSTMVAYGSLLGWLALTAGASPEAVATLVPAEVYQTALQVRGVSPAQQRLWYETNRATLDTCQSDPQLDPSWTVDVTSARASTTGAAAEGP